MRENPTIADIVHGRVDKSEAIRMGLNKPAQIEAGGEWYKMPLASITIGSTTYNLLRHPELYKMKHVDEWIDDYHYTQEFKVPIPYGDRCPLWVQAYNIYKYYYEGAQEWLKIQSNK